MCNASTIEVLQHTVDRGPNLEPHTAHTAVTQTSTHHTQHTHKHAHVHVRTRAKSKNAAKIQVNFFTRFLSFILFVVEISLIFLQMKKSFSFVISVLWDAIQL
jgi:ABC-type nickel/cobalt efflux system permease component RcnA